MDARSNFGKKGWGMIVYVLLLFLVSSAPVDLLNVSIEAFANTKHWNPNSLLVFSSIGGWLGVIGTLVFGLWVSKNGAKTPTIVGLFIFGIFFIINGQANSVAMYGFAVIVLNIISNCLNLVSTNTFMSNWFPRKKGIALGWASMGMPISSALSIPIFAAIFGKTGSIGSAFNFFGILVILIAIATIFYIKALPEEAGAYPDNEPISPEQSKANLEKMNNYESEWTIKKLLTCSQMWLIVFVFGFLFIGIVATMTQFVPRFTANGFTQPEAIMWLSIASILGILGSYLWGFLDQKISTKTTTIIFAIYMTLIQLLSAVFINNKEISTVLIVLIGVLIGGIGNLFPSMVIQVFGRYDFAAANKIIVPLLTTLRTSAFIIMVAVLSASNGSYSALCLVLGGFGLVATILSFFLSNKSISKIEYA